MIRISLFYGLLFSGILDQGFAQAQPIDLNGNGLDDVWEKVYNASSLTAAADTDRDGASNLEECTAGTNPFDPSSKLIVCAISQTADNVTLTWPSESGKEYHIEFSDALGQWRATNIRLGGNGSLVSSSLRKQPTSGANLLRRKWSVPAPYLYDGIEVAFQSGFLNSVPIEEEFVSNFRIAQTNPQENWFFVITKGFLTVPATGNYQFYVTAGDDSEFLLSTNEDPANAQTVASTPRGIPLNVFTWEDSQISAPIALAAGQRYYVETRLFEYIDTDHMQVAWTGPGIALQDIPGVVLEPYEALPGDDASFFRIAATDADADGDNLSDWSELKYGFSTQTPTTYNGVNDFTSISQELSGAQAAVHVAYVSPQGALDQAAGSGIATLRLGAGNSVADVSLEFNHLTADAYTTGIYIEPNGGGAGSLVYNSPDSEFVDSVWNFGASRNAILTALSQGRVYLRVLTGQGEWRGYFNSVDASMFFMAPAAPPLLSGGTPSRLEAIRFLNQATFGSDEASIASVRSLGFEGWIDQQLALPPSLHQPYAEELVNSREDPFWRNALTAPDQLRMRMAFALSQVFPVNSNAADGNPIASNHFYDKYVIHSFGNYRDLLEDMTLSPVMGTWLTYISNARANPVFGQRPDENYAREIMQLFTLGLVKLHPDGSLKIGRDGRPQLSYTQKTIENMARVFTGWGWPNPSGDEDFFFSNNQDYLSPMSSYPTYHDTDAKVIVNGVLLPADQSPEKDLADTLDALANHDNIGPFVSRLLIKRFTTSNPSPEYVYRVASAWNDNGSGVKGDLSAVIKAILLDYEARSPDLVSLPGIGKVKEPIIHWTGIFRALGVNPQPTSPQNPVRFSFNNRILERLGQEPMSTPTVFNFFRSDYKPPAISGQANLLDSGLTSPEFQILTETVAVSGLNRMLETVTDGHKWYSADLEILLDYQVNPAHPLLTMASGNSAALVDHLDEILLGGTLLNGTRAEIIAAIDDPVHNQSAAERLRGALYLMIASPEHAAQR